MLEKHDHLVLMNRLLLEVAQIRRASFNYATGFEDRDHVTEFGRSFIKNALKENVSYEVIANILGVGVVQVISWANGEGHNEPMGWTD